VPSVEIGRRHDLQDRLRGRVRVHGGRRLAERLVAAEPRDRRDVVASRRPVVAGRVVHERPGLCLAESRGRLVDGHRQRLVHLADEGVAARDDLERLVVLARRERRRHPAGLADRLAGLLGERPHGLEGLLRDDRERLVRRRGRALPVGLTIAVVGIDLRRVRWRGWLRRLDRVQISGRVERRDGDGRRCVDEGGGRGGLLRGARCRCEQVEGADEGGDLGVARIRVEHPRVPPSCVVELSGRAGDVAHVPQGDHVLGVEVECGLEQRTGIVARARLVQRLAEHDLPAHVIGLLRQLLAADGDGAVEVPRPPVLVGERGEIAARVLFEFPLQLVDPGGASQCKSPEKRHGAPLEAGGRTWQHTARTFGKSIGELTLSLDFRGRPPLPCWALAGPFFLVHL
jgi:hypothetical protein